MKNKSFILILLSILILTSCNKNLLYLSDLQTQKIEQLVPNYQPYHLQPYDYLDITIKTSDEKINNLLNIYNRQNQQIAINQRNSGSENYFFYGYMVNDSGYIFIPVIGKFNVKGKTVDQVQNLVQQRVDSIFSDAYVSVKLISFQIYFLGEVSTTRTFYKRRLNILQALSEVGGLPYTADKKHVFILRRQDSTIKVFTLDLTSKHLIENKDFYLQPYDIVYIRPRKAQIFRLSTQDYYFIVSLVTTTASVISLILSLKR